MTPDRSPRELLGAPPDLLALRGGDGTVNEIASSVPAPPFPVAIIPAGTANVLARELGIPLNPVRAVQIALKRTVRKLDLGRLGAGMRRFLFVAGSALMPRLSPALSLDSRTLWEWRHTLLQLPPAFGAIRFRSSRSLRTAGPSLRRAVSPATPQATVEACCFVPAPT